jgi:predicted nuclease of predicted toxin-antitoxin system
MQPDKLEFWIDMNLPSCLAHWIENEFKVTAKSFAELGYHTTSDMEVFKKAVNNTNIIVITTKDFDFLDIKNRQVVKPKILYLNIGNVTNKTLRKIFDLYFSEAFKLLSQSNQSVVEINYEHE